jgi:peroxidase
MPFFQAMDDELPIDCCCKYSFDKKNDEQIAAVCLPIKIPSNDPFFKNKTDCMNFARSKVSLGIDCKPRPFQQINQITHWLDGSNIYGSEDKVTEELRTKQDGLLKTQTAPDGGELLPFDNRSLECTSTMNNCFLAGMNISRFRIFFRLLVSRWSEVYSNAYPRISTTIFYLI